jgi:predicted GIY-YIG superfamily endonuclease
MKYYKITARGGHIGSKREVSLVFYFEAKNINDAIKRARNMPGVKHNKPDAITNAKEISKEEYEQNIEGYSAYNVYNNR